jgi:tRNA nucleotidyltransferase (CCA-adding enzyme)
VKIRSVSDPTLPERARALPGLELLAGVRGVFLVGGAVRDLLRAETPEDLDLAVEGELGPVLARLGEPAARHERFGTATVIVGGRRIDLARTRAESYPRPGALPEVRPAGIGEDLRRRDFTVNTLALDLASGELRSVPGAEEDLAAGRLRVLHPRSFADDPTRLLRMARYAGRLGFRVEEETGARARAAVCGGALGTVSGPRIGTEVGLLAREPVAAWAALRELGADEAIVPGFGLRDPDLAARALGRLGPDDHPDRVVLALLFAGVEDPHALARRLGLPAPEPVVAVRGRSRTEVADALRSPEQAAIAAALGGEEEAGWWLEEGRRLALEITGDDLRAAGVAPGPEMGRALRAVLAAKREGEVSGRPAELALALRILGA